MPHVSKIANFSEKGIKNARLATLPLRPPPWPLPPPRARQRRRPRPLRTATSRMKERPRTRKVDFLFLLALWETRIYFVFNLSVPFSMKTRSSKKTKRTTAPTTVRPPPKKKDRRGKTKGAKVISRILYVRKRRT